MCKGEYASRCSQGKRGALIQDRNRVHKLSIGDMGQNIPCGDQFVADVVVVSKEHGLVTTKTVGLVL
jgi:hypothetical protein